MSYTYIVEVIMLSIRLSEEVENRLAAEAWQTFLT